MSWRVFLVGMLAWIVLPVLAIGAACLWVAWQNSAAQTGLLTASVSPGVVFSGSETTGRFRFDGTALAAAQREPPLDIVFAIDVSTSVQESIGELSAAVLATARGLARPGGDAPRFAVLSFSNTSQMLLDWSGDQSRLAAAMQSLAIGGGTVFGSTSLELDRLLNTRRSGARAALVVYTDGLFQDWGDANDYASKLRSRGVDLFVVGMPNAGLPEEVLDFVGGRPERMLQTGNIQQLSYQFLQLKQQLTSGVGFDARLRVPLDGRHFAIGSRPSRAWGSDGVNPVAYLGTLGQRYEETELPLRALSFGIWRVGTAAPRLTYADANGQIQEATAAHRPALLVLSVPFLILAFLPAPLWVLLYLWTRPRAIDHVREPLPDVPLPPPLPVLPEPGVPPLPRSNPVPTLLIGLGDAGGRCLEELEAHLRRRGESRDSLLLDGLWVHVARAAAEARTKDPAVVPPLAVTHLQRVISGPAPLPAHLAWFPQAEYRDGARASLSVEHGCNFDRRLGRLALFNWLHEGELEARLAGAVEALLRRAPADAPRQIVVFAGAAGGFAGGVLIDVCRLVRRAARTAAGPGATAPDVIAIALGSEVIGDPRVVGNLKALHDELETARLERSFPVPTPYRAEEGDADRQSIALAPFDQVFWVPGRGEQETVAQAAALASVLTDARPRGRILSDLSAADAVLFSQVNAALLSPDQPHALVEAELFLRIMGPEVVADIEPSPSGGYQAKPVAPGRAEELLHALHASAEAGGAGGWSRLWARLLGHAAGTAVAPLSEAEREEFPELTLAWLREAFCCSFNALLDGRRRRTEAGTGLPTTSEAAALLQHLARRIDAGADAAAVQVVVTKAETLRQFAGELAAAGRALDGWIDAACVRAGAVALQKQRAAQALKPSGDGAIIRLEPSALDRDRLPELTENALRRWLPDTPTAAESLRDYLHFRLLPDESGMLVVLAGLGRAQPEAALDRLQAHAAAIARTVGPADILEHLDRLEAPELERVAAALRADRRSPAWRAFVVVPRHHPDAAPAVRRLLDRISERPGAGPQTVIDGDDRTGVMRLSIATDDASLAAETAGGESLPYAQEAETAAERMRQRLERRYERRVPTLSPPLRLALAQPTAFAAFAQAYAAGQVVRRTDQSGNSQWVDAATGALLTTGSAPTLAEAAAAFACRWRASGRAAFAAGTHATAADDGLFTPLEEWKGGGDDARGDALVLAAIECTLPRA